MANDSLHPIHSESMLRAFRRLRVLLPAICCAVALQTLAFAQSHPYHSPGATHSSSGAHSSAMPQSVPPSAVSEVVGNKSTSSQKELVQLERSSLAHERSTQVTRAAERSRVSSALPPDKHSAPINFTSQPPRTYSTRGGVPSGRVTRAR